MAPMIHFLFIPFFLVFVITGSACADELRGKVVGVADGDTLTLLDNSNQQHKIRLAGIDAPESRQPFGEKAKQYLSKLAFGKNVIVEWHKHDKYGRVVGKVLVPPPGCDTCPPSKDAGLLQLEAGLAWWYRQYRKEQTLEDQGYYEYAQYVAQRERTGLWVDSEPVPPWEWRKRKLRES